VKDTSLKVPSGTYGIVMDVKVSAKKDTDSESENLCQRREAPRQGGRGRLQEEDR
jgi:DNA-directed RNA polymerase beta subunit